VIRRYNNLMRFDAGIQYRLSMVKPRKRPDRSPPNRGHSTRSPIAVVYELMR